MNFDGKVMLCRMYEKTSARGNRYFAGRLGAASVVMFKDEHGDAENCWQVFVQSPPPAQDKAAAAPPTRAAATPPPPPAARPRDRRRSKVKPTNGGRWRIPAHAGDLDDVLPTVQP